MGWTDQRIAYEISHQIEGVISQHIDELVKDILKYDKATAKNLLKYRQRLSTFYDLAMAVEAAITCRELRPVIKSEVIIDGYRDRAATRFRQPKQEKESNGQEMVYQKMLSKTRQCVWAYLAIRILSTVWKVFAIKISYQRSTFNDWTLFFKSSQTSTVHRP